MSVKLYSILIEPQQLSTGEVVYFASHPDLPGCNTHGFTIQASIEMLEDARDIYLRMLKERGLPIPEAQVEAEETSA